MAESLLGRVSAEENETREVEASEALAGAEAFAAAVAAIESRQDPGVARKTEIFLQHQAELLKIQAAHLKDEHPLRLAHLRNQLREEWLRRLGLRFRVAFQLFVALAATAVGVGALIIIHDAVTSHWVVIEPFHAPAGFPGRGVDGVVVASGLLDELNHLQDATRVGDESRDVSSAWAKSIKLEVPETGLSLGEISRLLKERFGHDVHIDGELVETAKGGLALTVRGSGVAPKTFDGSVTELAKVTREAAEYVLMKSRPTQWAKYLSNMGRYAEAIEFCRTSVASASPGDRANLLDTWATTLQTNGGSIHESLVLYREAARLKPDLWIAQNNIQNALIVLGDEEGAWRAGENLRKAAGGRPGRAPETYYQNWDLLTWNVQAWLDGIVSDAATNGGFGTAASAAGVGIADIRVRMHDPDGADLALKTTKEDPHDPSIAAVTHFVHGRIAADAGDTARAAMEMEAFGAAYADPALAANYAGYNCWIAPVEEAAGHPGKANAVLRTGGTYVDCYRFRADILDVRGDWPAAQKAYAEAVALAADLPAAYYSWGAALARHGDLAAATEKLKEANRRGPHWADPLKTWGDVLVRQVRMKEALAKYDEALTYAPNWAALKEARAAAVKPKI